MGRRQEEPVRFPKTVAKHMTDKALLCVIDGEEHWIPLGQIDDDSEVYDDDDHAEGTLVVTAWIAKQKGLV